MYTHTTSVLFHIKLLGNLTLKGKYSNFLMTGVSLLNKYLMRKMRYVIKYIDKVLYSVNTVLYFNGQNKIK